jgi:hypothetical protein
MEILLRKVLDDIGEEDLMGRNIKKEVRKREEGEADFVE